MLHPVVPSDTNRIVILGSSSSGKTTLAKGLSSLFGIPHIELDAFRFLPNWQTRTDDEFRVLVDEATSQPHWVVDGNYGMTRDLTWGRADTAIWLDYPLPLIMWRLTKRTLGRWYNQTELWNTGNRETLWKHFLPNDDSLYYWVLKTYWRRKREMPSLMASPEHAHLRFVVLKSPAETAAWLATLRRVKAA